ncbi:4-alpha-glucanotransferase [Nitrospira moscoviensis]|uniref:4-alpha-glucanotransferase n=1 Tax=Nitrospira moscoviensis TaxID=42253 RepID=A0A0K2G9G5_NITMO|nr:4-alpha-glucanotransferase [Nitrospira moscoviensis]ALA57593.1 4-alpha-glucanotransferase [Nitrospira moscoviensis]
MYDQPETELLRLLAERAGIASEYHDIAGTQHVTTDETRRAILAAMGFRPTDRAALIEELTAWDNGPWLRGCDPVRVTTVGRDPGSWSLYVPCESPDDQRVQVHWLIHAENGEKRYEREEGPGLAIGDSRIIDNRRYITLTFPLPSDLPMGYYEVKAWAQGGQAAAEASFRLIVAPDRCHVPDTIRQGERLWGFALQLYSLRSERNWGIGDFRDLGDVVEWAGKLGAGVLGLNPLHALKNVKPYHISPYAPTSRLFLNDLYIDVEQVAECKTSPEVQKRLADPSFRAQLDAARASELVDYNAVASAKRAVLDLCYRAFLRENFEGTEPDLTPKTARGWFFHQYVQQEGEPLAQYALFQALEDERQFVQSRSVVWADWPEHYRSPASDAVAEFKRRHMKRVRFFQYLQWLAADQMATLVAKTHEAGMPIGFYHDLALGSDRYGADGWRFQDVLAMKADCGAPPDAFAPEGQNWGLSPADPVRLRAGGYEYVIEILRNNLRYGGAIRIDHVMALFRLFWIPRGLPASKGTYVHYPAEDLLAILALESARAKALVIGEDLGTVPDWVRERLAAAGVLSYRVFYFERTGSGALKPPGSYPAQSLAVVTTHDLPTLAGYWEGADIETRAKLGLFASDQARIAMLAERRTDKARILAALKSEGLLPEGVPDDPAHTPAMTTELADAVHQYLARTPSWIVLANVEDLLGVRAQTNLPGTVDEHPNWCRKLPVSLRELMRDPRSERLAGQLRQARPVV